MIERGGASKLLSTRRRCSPDPFEVPRSRRKVDGVHAVVVKWLCQVGAARPKWNHVFLIARPPIDPRVNFTAVRIEYYIILEDCNWQASAMDQLVKPCKAICYAQECHLIREAGHLPPFFRIGLCTAMGGIRIQVNHSALKIWCINMHRLITCLCNLSCGTSVGFASCQHQAQWPQDWAWRRPRRRASAMRVRRHRRKAMARIVDHARAGRYTSRYPRFAPTPTPARVGGRA